MNSSLRTSALRLQPPPPPAYRPYKFIVHPPRPRRIIQRVFIMGGTSAQYLDRKLSLRGYPCPRPPLVRQFLVPAKQGKHAATPR